MAIMRELEENFSQFGLVHRASAFRKKNCFAEEENNSKWFAYVVFYSTWDFEKALQSDGKIKIGETEIRIWKKARNKPHQKFLLPLHKAQELLTHYFGFNCWTSKVIYLEREKEVERPDVIRYVCMVSVNLPREDLCSEGVGIGEVPLNEASPISRGYTFCCGRRFAFQSAMKAAFSKFIIIRLKNGKITAEVDTTQCDPLIYDPAWDNPVVKVNDVNYDPDDEEECEDLEDMTEEQLEELLNVPL
ncbi:RAD52 motif-containing protein 1-like isoform X2 [Homarus americanus]|uniref:RAD52 motif-containing protein 1-like isoform X2 n=1 Tax=Homarus americanus TaxID=6706 RepID=UPI001C48ABBE|nr:RAD52 motif-containing protein 1-like isoform X2 [Homarus americanus]